MMKITAISFFFLLATLVGLAVAQEPVANGALRHHRGTNDGTLLQQRRLSGKGKGKGKGKGSTPSPTESPTPSPTPSPTDSPTEGKGKGKGKGSSSSKGGGKGVSRRHLQNILV